LKRINELSGGALEWTDGMLYPCCTGSTGSATSRPRWDSPEGGRQRRYYRITAAGRTALSEQRRQYEVIVNPATQRGLEFNGQFNSAEVNPTIFVTEVALFRGKHENYIQAVSDLFDRIERHPDVTVLRTENNFPNWSTLRARVREEDQSTNPWSSDKADVSESQVSPETISLLRDRVFNGAYNDSVLNGDILRIPVQTKYGTGGAIYVFETVKRVRLEVIRKVATPIPIPPEYTIEVLLDQGTALSAGDASRVRFNRESMALETYRDLDRLVGTSNGKLGDSQLRQFAEVWHDLSATSGGWIGGGAGVNHLLMAAAFKKLTGTNLPGLKEPADLAATMKFTREEFVEYFMSGGLFRNGDQAFREIRERP
ncbi:MAG: hypothetical protein HC850_00595, partial [Rhodomicrobium sp.]|nr:hypothetical protein [Rhodomicrobium sp.]